MTDMVAPNPFDQFQAQSGLRYTADAQGIIFDVAVGDEESLKSVGCSVADEPVSRETSVVAAGSDASDATLVSDSRWIRIIECSSGQGIIVRPAVNGKRHLLMNDTGTTCTIYPDQTLPDTFSLGESSGMSSFPLFPRTAVDINSVADGVWNGIYSADVFD